MARRCSPLGGRTSHSARRRDSISALPLAFRRSRLGGEGASGFDGFGGSVFSTGGGGGRSRAFASRLASASISSLCSSVLSSFGGGRKRSFEMAARSFADSVAPM